VTDFFQRSVDMGPSSNDITHDFKANLFTSSHSASGFLLRGRTHWPVGQRLAGQYDHCDRPPTIQHQLR
jgi:hypothetical protein